MSRRKTNLFRQVRHIPGDIRSKSPIRRKNAYLTILTALLIIAVVLMGIYAAVWYIERGRIMNDSRRYHNMYTTLNPVRTTSVPETAAPVPTEAPTPEPTSTPAAVPASAPAETPTPEPTTLPSPSPTQEIPADIALDPTPVPLATPDENTLVFALPTPPPVQSSFDELLSLNGDTIGFLEIEDVIALPVVQKTNDNDYYLTHNFEGREAIEGTLFLDGSNLLVPEDDCLIVYGHNMKNDTMFGRLEAYQDMTFLKKHPVVKFDTLYENRSYVPFAAFAASMDKDSSHYFDVRQFVFDETGFELFTLRMQTRSAWEVPVDVRWGDRLLLLVTCDYTNTSGRFILCLREIREDESEAALRAAIEKVQAR